MYEAMRGTTLLLAPMSRRVMLVDVAGDRFRAQSGVAFQRTDGGMSRPGEQDRRIRPILGCMGQRGMAQLMELKPGLALLNNSAARR
jgi:hypothetical protein